MKVAIVDYGMGNLHSVLKSLETVNDVGADIVLTADAATIAAADKVVFPGQGAMPDCMRSLQNQGLADVILSAAKTRPFFGICVGAQLLLDFSEEGDTAGLGIFAGKVQRFARGLSDAQGRRLKIPHMGWNRVFTERAHPMFDGVEAGAWFYFVHSYYFVPENPDISLAHAHYPTPFSCVIGRDNIFATQFHTEKSGAAGLRLMRNFLHWDGQA